MSTTPLQDQARSGAKIVDADSRSGPGADSSDLADRNVPIVRIDGDVALEHSCSTVLASLTRVARKE
jgi:hypothetical protein